MKTKIMTVIICALLAIIIVTNVTTIGEAGTGSISNQLREINNRLKKIERQQKHDSIEYVEIMDDGINVVYADGTGAFWGDQRTRK